MAVLGVGAAAAASALAIKGAAAIFGVAILGSRRRGGRHRYGKRRYGRYAGQAKQEVPALLNSLLEVVWRGDASHCSEKLTCVLAATPEDSLHLSGKEILDMVRALPRPGEVVLSSGSGEYQRAVDVGSSGGSCDLSFPQCVASGQQLMKAMTSA